MNGKAEFIVQDAGAFEETLDAIRGIQRGRRQCNYRILFTVAEGEVHILHVRHGARLTLGESAQELR